MSDYADEKTSLLSNSSKKDYTLEISGRHDYHKRYDSVTNQLVSVTYTWDNLNVWAKIAQKSRCFGFASDKYVERQILHSICGESRPGELLAIIGSSGAGKTSLLNALTFRNTESMRIEGTRIINGVSVGPDDLSALSAYIQQDDLFIGTLTVKEHLIFQARLRMPRQVSYEGRLQRVNEVMQEVGLTKCADTLIGVTGRINGISGGEQKRLAIASELLTDPLLLFADEPTSGLDSFMAQNIVEILKQMSTKGKSVVATIHQPSSEIYSLFDRVIYMAESRVAFMGTTEEAITFFSLQGLRCPLNYNPADYFVEALAVQPGCETESRKRILQTCDAFEERQRGIVKFQDISGTQKNETEEFLQMQSAISNQSVYRASWLSQFRAVFWRSCLTLIKEPMLIRMRLFQTIVVALIFGLLFAGQKLDQDGIMNIKGVLFIFITSLTFQNVFSVVNVFSAELPVFFREHFNGMYRTDVYMLSKTLAELPLQILYPCVFLSISYYVIGLNPDIMKFLNALMIVVLISNITCSFGYFVACSSPSHIVSMAIAPTSILPLLIFGGYFLNKQTIPPFLAWLKYLSWFLYGFEALSINQWTGVDKIECGQPNITSTCLDNGGEVLFSLHFEPEDYMGDLLGLITLLVAFRVAAFLVLLAKTMRWK